MPFLWLMEHTDPMLSKWHYELTLSPEYLSITGCCGPVALGVVFCFVKRIVVYISNKHDLNSLFQVLGKTLPSCFNLVCLWLRKVECFWLCLLALLLSCIYSLLTNSAQLLNPLNFSLNAKSFQIVFTLVTMWTRFSEAVCRAYVLHQAKRKILEVYWVVDRVKIPQLLPETPWAFLPVLGQGLTKHRIKEKEGNYQLVQQYHCYF